MEYSPHQIYHVFNQGNNKQQVFFSKYNYFLFLKKVKQYIIPNADILSYCLMPNHFHLLIYMNALGCNQSYNPIAGYKKDENIGNRYQQQFSKDLSTLLRSYTRAINNQNNRSGSLFRNKTKAKQGSNDFVIAKLPKTGIIELDYEQTCFNYIHQNPVKAGLVKKDIDWPYSSAREYAFRLKDGICNKQLSAKLGLIY
jgi:putative transposase